MHIENTQILYSVARFFAESTFPFLKDDTLTRIQSVVFVIHLGNEINAKLNVHLHTIHLKIFKIGFFEYSMKTI